MAGFLLKQQHITIANNKLALKLLNKRLLEYSIYTIFFIQFVIEEDVN